MSNTCNHGNYIGRCAVAAKAFQAGWDAALEALARGDGG